MANYIQGHFVIPTSSNDTYVRVKDRFGNVKLSIDPLLVTIMFVKLNVINIRMTSSNNILLIDFISPDDAKKALVELRTEMDKILHRVSQNITDEKNLISQLSSGPDFTTLYETGTVSATSSINTSIDDRLTDFIAKLSSDFSNLKNQEVVNLSYNVNQLYSESLNQHYDILGVTFSTPSDGKVSIYINGVYLMLGTGSNNISYMSSDGGVTTQDYITIGSRLYINPYLLSYDLDTYDVITLSYLTKLV